MAAKGNGWASVSTKLTWLAGLAGVAWEAVVRDGQVRLPLILLYAAMMGLARLGDLIQLILPGTTVRPLPPAAETEEVTK